MDHKLRIDAEGEPQRLHHLPPDPDEAIDLIDGAVGDAEAALDLLTSAARRFPETVGRPRYDALPARPVDKKPAGEQESSGGRQAGRPDRLGKP